MNEMIKAARDKTHGLSRTPVPETAETFVSDETGQNRFSAKVSHGPIMSHVQVDRQVRFSEDQNVTVSQQPQKDPERVDAKRWQRSEMSESASVSHEPSMSSPVQLSQAGRVDPIAPPTCVLPDHVAVTTTSPAADPVRCESGESGSPDVVRTQPRDSDFRPEISGQFVRGHMAGPRMGPIYDSEISEQHQGSTSPLPQVHRTQSGESGTRACKQHQPSSGSDHSQGQAQVQSHGKEHRHGISHLFAGWRDRMGLRTRDVRDADYEPTAHATDGRDCRDANKDAQHGECPDESDQAHRGPGQSSCRRSTERELVREDWSHEVLTSMHHETNSVLEMVQKFSKELHESLSKVKPLGTRWSLGEVMCSSNSPLTHQVQTAGKSAFRYGLAQGDLSTVDGRKGLFHAIARHRPKHIWYSPVCGPWSSWSQLNASKSWYHHQEYQVKRSELLYQIALGVVLYRHQVSNGDHFHWEQPRKSLMFQNASLSEIHEHTQTCEFDMCRAGNLVDPENGLALKKGMSVITTFPPMFQRLHGLTCQHNHQHQPIEGSCKMKDGKSMLRTKYTEVYPRKFARMIAQLIIKGEKWWPFHWKPGMQAFGSVGTDQCTENDPILTASPKGKTKTNTVRSQFRQKPAFARSELVTPGQRESLGAKRLKSDSCQGVAPTLEMCQQVIQDLSQQLPRVGRREITQENIVQQLQNIFPDKIVMRVMACRGTERTMEPPKKLHPQEAPYRRMLLLQRDVDVKYERHWEDWTRLSKRQLVRPSHPCRINITVFAKDQEHHRMQQENPKELVINETKDTKVPCDNLPSRGTVQDGDPIPSTPEPQVNAKDAAQTDSRVIQPEAGTSTMAGPNTPAMETDVRSPELQVHQQGFRFRSLPMWEQQAILRMHPILGIRT